MKVSFRFWLALLLILFSLTFCGCAQVMREGVREGRIIGSETLCKSCLISTETKMEFAESNSLNKIKIFKEATYGDSYRKKYEAEGYKELAHPPIIRSFLARIFIIPFTAGLVLLTPSYYTDPIYDCRKHSECSYSTDTWIIENEYQYSTETRNTYTKSFTSNDPVTVSIYGEHKPSSVGSYKENDKIAKPAKKAKKAKKIKKAASSNTTGVNISSKPTFDNPVTTQTVNAVDGVVDVDLCKLRNELASSGEYLIRYESADKKLESYFKPDDLARYCPDSEPVRIDKVFNQIEMPTPPE